MLNSNKDCFQVVKWQNKKIVTKKTLTNFLIILKLKIVLYLGHTFKQCQQEVNVVEFELHHVSGFATHEEKC